MNEPAPSDVRSSEFSSAWSAFDQATHAAQRAANTWNDLVGTDLFRTNVYVEEDGTGRVDVLVDEYEGHRLDDLELAARLFVEELLASAREALRAAEQCVSGALRRPMSEHLPLFGAVSEFLDFIETGALSGLRPDQIQLIEQFQPYYRSNPDDAAHQQFRAIVTRMFNLATMLQRNSRRAVAFWAHSADPVVEAEARFVNPFCRRRIRIRAPKTSWPCRELRTSA